MSAIINIIIVSIGALFFSIPIFNRYVFHTVNIDQIIVDGKEGLEKIAALQNKGQFEESRDSARSLIDRFRNDSLEILPGDIISWDTVLARLAREPVDRGTQLLKTNINREDLAKILACRSSSELTPEIRRKIAATINRLVSDPDFYISSANALVLDPFPRIASQLKALEVQGILIRGGDGKHKVIAELEPHQRKELKRFHISLAEEFFYNGVLRKNPKRNADWASEYIVQTAYYYIGGSYNAQYEFDRAIIAFDSLITLYPKTIYAEVIFLLMGQVLYADGKNMLMNGQVSEASKKLRRAIGYLEKIERNREIARRFPKYKYADLVTDEYLNVDAASKAKRKIKEKVRVLTSAEAKEQLSSKTKQEQSGYTLEDAIKLIGECYLLLGETDSARMQFQLILDFFPESDNLDNAQKLIADSYAKEADLLAAKAQTEPALQAKVNEKYALAIASYQKFVNLYPQSDIISETYIAMADVYYKINRKAEADICFATALEMAKNTEEKAKVQLQIGNYFKERNMYQQAIQAYQLILKNFLSTEVAPNAQYLLGICYDNIGDSSKAEEAYSVIVEYYKKSQYFAASAYRLGDRYLQRKAYNKALEMFRLGRTYGRDDDAVMPKMQFKIGQVWHEISKSQHGERKELDIKEAINAYMKTGEDFAGTDEADQAYFQAAQCYLELGNKDAARAAIDKIERRDARLAGRKLFVVKGESADTLGYEGELDYWNNAIANSIDNEEQATAWYEKAQLLNDKMKKFEEALQAYQKTLELTADEVKKVNARIGISRIYIAQKKYFEAEKLMLELIQNKSASIEVKQQLQIQLFDTYYKMEKYDDALEGFEKFVSQYPDHKLADYCYYRIGMVYSEKKQPQKAIEKFNVVIEKYKGPNNKGSDYEDKAVLGVGTQMAFLGEHKKAIDYLHKYIKDRPEKAAAVSIYLKIAELWNDSLKEPLKALETYAVIDEKYSADPLYSYSSYKYGELLKKQGNDAKAIEVFKKVKREGNAAVFRAAQAEMGKLIAKKDPEAAIKNFYSIVEESETAEDSATAMIGIGDVYNTIGKWNEAAEIFKKVHDFYNGTDTSLLAGAIVKWADALVKAERYQEVIRAAEIMQKRFPNHQYTVNTQYFEASANMALKNFSRAKTIFNDIVKANRNEQLTEIATYQKADCTYFPSVIGKEVNMNGLRAAIAEYDEYLKKYPKGTYRARAVFMKGSAYFALQDWKNAMVNFENIVNNYPDFPDMCNAKNYLASSLDKLDRWKDATKYFNEVIRNSTCNKAAREYADKNLEAIHSRH